MLADDDPNKWRYPARTQAKHAVLRRYMKAWLPILGNDAHRRGRLAHLTIVDAFAGRGRYVSGEPGSPLIFRELAEQSLTSRHADQVDLYLIEANPANHDALAAEVTQLPLVGGLSGKLLPRAEFAALSERLLADLSANPRPSFWFIDPFGFAGFPLMIIRDIMGLAQSEAFINFMVRDINRFVEELRHAPAIREMYGFNEEEYEHFTRSITGSAHRVPALREAYEARLRTAANTKFAWSYRVAEGGAEDTVYYLIHAANHIKAFREMKDATHEESAHGGSAFLGKDDFGARAQLELFGEDAEVREGLLEVFASRTITFDELCDEAYPDPRFPRAVEADFRKALNALATEGRIRKTPVTSSTTRGLRGADLLQFPPRT